MILAIIICQRREKMEIVYNKLIRDKIVDIIEKDGKKAVVSILDDEQYKKELLKKLLEEANEVASSSEPNEMLEELADVLEVIRYLAKTSGKKLEDVIGIADEKKAKRGGFDDKIFLEKTIF